MYLAQMLGEVPENEVELFGLLFDPVPGNLPITARLDIAKKTTTNCFDLSRARTLRKVLSIYPYEALSDVACHAPVIAWYPPSSWCEVEEDVTLGCH